MSETGEDWERGNGLLPSPPSRDGLKRLAAEPDPRAPIMTRAGRSLQKHGYRSSGSAFPRVSGPPAVYNTYGQQIVDALVDNPETRLVVRLKRRGGRMLPFVEVTAPDGLKVGYLSDVDRREYVFDGFREP